MTYTRITALWTGGTGLPGYSRFKFSGDLTAAEATTAAGRVRTFFDAIKVVIPGSISITFSEAAQHFDVFSKLTGEVALTPPAAVVGTGTAGYAAASGMVVNWTTGQVINNRKVRGRTFLVPCSSAAFDGTGQPTQANVTLINTAAAALVAGTPSLMIAGLYGDLPNGYAVIVNGGTCPKRGAVLRSRRD